MSDRIAFSAIIQELADRTAKSPEECQRFVEELTELLTNEILENEKGTITNFGSFSKVEISEREGVNPANGQPMTIPAHVRVGFSPYKSLEEAVNEPFSHLEPSFIEDEDDEDEFDSGVSDSGKEKDKEPEDEGKKDKPVSVKKYKENQLKINREQPRGPWSIIFTVVLVAVILFGIWWAFFRADSTGTLIPAEDSQPSAMTQPEQELPPAGEDTTQEVAPETTEPAPPVQTVPDTTEPADEIASVSDEPEAQFEIPESYTVIGGEWLYDIARNVYGDPDLWTLIYKANTDKMRRPDEIRHGLVLSIPSIEGNPGNLTKNDSVELSQAYLIVADAYKNLNEDEKAASYRRYSSRYAQN